MDEPGQLERLVAQLREAVLRNGCARIGAQAPPPLDEEDEAAAEGEAETATA